MDCTPHFQPSHSTRTDPFVEAPSLNLVNSSSRISLKCISPQVSSWHLSVTSGLPWPRCIMAMSCSDAVNYMSAPLAFFQFFHSLLHCPHWLAPDPRCWGRPGVPPSCSSWQMVKKRLHYKWWQAEGLFLIRCYILEPRNNAQPRPGSKGCLANEWSVQGYL